MKQQSGGMFSGVMVVRPESWHGRMYNYWQEHAKFKNNDSYRENLCHYSRVVLIWAPMAWLSQTWLIDGICRFGSTISGGLGGGVGRFCSSLNQFFKKHELALGRVGMFIAGAFLIIGLGNLIIYLIHNPMQVLLGLVYGVAISAAFGAFGFGLALAISKLMDMLKREKSTSKPVRSTIQLAGHVIMAKKRGICPYIEFADDGEPLEAEEVSTVPAMTGLNWSQDAESEHNKKVPELV